MYLRIKLILLLICIFCIHRDVYGQKVNYQQFENIYLGTEASVISCFLQDSEGMIWIGSNKGLFSYDGYSTQQHFTYGELTNTCIYCGIIIDNTYLYLGTDNGILVYNYRTDRYEQPEVDFPTDVRTMALRDRILWIGSLNGLYTYQLENRKLTRFDSKHSGLSHNTIYSIIHTKEKQTYVGTYNGLCRYIAESGKFEDIFLPVTHGISNLFVNSLLEDTVRQCIWIGMEGYLLQYTPETEKMVAIEVFHNNSIKSLALDGNGNLLAGTDNGLYVYQNNEEPLQHIIHDSRNIQSLTNNIIWNIFSDQEHNIWLGTDYGISLSRYNSALQFVPISQITGTGDGNQFYSLFRDSKGMYWFGGTNGLLRFIHPTGNRHEAVWYRMGDKAHPLSHNRIRHIYEDKEQQLWIATDGSINRYDYTTQEFVHYNIIDSTGTYNTNWAYYIFEDDSGNLWIATCLGGIFVVDKHKLMQSKVGQYVAEYNYSIHNGLSGMFINQIMPDKEGNVWVLLYNSKGLDKINPRTKQVTKLFSDELSGEKSPNYLLCDAEGMLWVGFHGGVMRINPKDSSRQSISFGNFNNNEILSMTSVKDHIWVSTTNGLWIINRETMDARQQNMTDKRFTSLLFDSKDGNVYLGGADGFAISCPEIQAMNRPERPILLTALYINNQLMDPRIANIPNIRYTNAIELKYNQNNLAFELSDLPYSLEEKNKFVYRLGGMDKEWNFLPSNTNRITYSNLSYGDYQLSISKVEKNGVPSEHPYILDIKILPPWYYTLWAKIIYCLLLLSLVAWTINFFRVKNRLKMERLEKEKILEQSRQKMAFFTNLSNELKTPLSRIIAPVSQLLPATETEHEKQTLEEVQRNAMKINSLIHQVLNFNRIEGNADSLLILSRIELVSFSRSLFSVYEENSRLTFHFEANKAKIYADMDAIKLGVILDNLLSNAVKYTPDSGSVRCSLFYSQETGQLDICVSDTGTGIPQQDIPYIFQHFYQSPRSGNKEGTDIGLYLVKTYTELHGGHINGVTSKENQGTSIGLSIPITAIEEEGITPSHQTKKSLESLPVLKPIEAESQDEKFLSNIIRLIEDHLSDADLNVNALCELSGFSNKQIYRKIKQLTGMSPVEYIKSIRMKKAAMLLQQKKFTIAEVMYMVGFSNHSYFSKCFQSEFGKTPRQYLNEEL